jgi:lipoate-protein ligase A
MAPVGTKLRLVGFACWEAHRNMALDAHLLELCQEDPADGFLRFYTWARPTLSMGYLEPPGVVNHSRAARDGVEVVRRPTGGRVVLHGDDLTYAAVLPLAVGRTLSQTYLLISETLVEGLNAAGAGVELEPGKAGKSQARRKPCFASVSRYEITYEGRKLVGSAQRIAGRALLQHGSIPLGPGYLGVAEYMSGTRAQRENLRLELEASTVGLGRLLGRDVDAVELSSQLARAFQRRFGFAGTPLAAADFDPGHILFGPEIHGLNPQPWRSWGQSGDG